MLFVVLFLYEKLNLFFDNDHIFLKNIIDMIFTQAENVPNKG